MTGRWSALAAALLLAACGGRIVPPATDTGRPAGREAAPPPAIGYVHPRAPVPVRRPTPAIPIAPTPFAPRVGAVSAVDAGVVPGPPIARLPITPAMAGAALASFRASCPSLLRRADTSGLTRPADWQAACAAAGQAGTDPLGIFQQYLESVQIGDGHGYATGYYVPELDASLDRRPGYDTPIYARPSDLVDVDLGLFSDALRGKKVRGRVEGTALVPYYDRAAIVGGAIEGRARVLAWAADPVAVFFLQVQGSGVLRLPDGGALTIGYDSANGRDYTGIGGLMRTRGLVGPDQLSMQGIVRYLHDNPDQARRLMDENKSYVFFRPLAGDPVGALGLPVIGGVSAAVDPRFVPLGAPVFLSMDRLDATALWVAQDTGGAIKGANRFDTFWGSGREAEAIAGGMSARGSAFVLLPIGTLDRLRSASDDGAVPRP